MTIRLLCAYDKYPANAIVTLDAGTEAGLIAAQQATATLTGGAVFYAPVAVSQSPQTLVGGGKASLKGGEQTTIPLPEGQALTITGAAGTVGVASLLNSALTWAIGAGALAQIGPYAGTQRVLITCSAGSIEATVGSAVLGVKSTTQRPKSNVLSFSLAGFLDAPVAVVTNPYSLMVQTVLEAPFDTMRIGILNADNSAVAGVKVSVGAGSTLGAGNGTLGLTAAGQPTGGVNFLPATFGGAASGTLAAAAAASTGATGANIGGSDCSITWTDWVLNGSVDRVDGTSGLPCVNVIVTWPAGVNRTRILMDGTSSTGWDNESSVGNRPFRVMAAATKDAVGNPAWMLVSNAQAARTYTDFPPIVVQYTLRNGYGETLLVYGDSIREGAGATVQKYGYPREFQAMISTAKNPVSICNLAVAGSNMVMWEKRVAATLSSFTQVSVDIPSLTPNSLSAPQTSADMIAVRKSFANLRQAVDKVGLMHFTDTCLPTNSSVSPGQVGPKNYGASDITYRAAYNAALRNSGYRVSDFDGVAAWAIDSSGQYCLPAAYTDDGIHPNSVLYKLMAGVRLAAWMAN